MYLRSKKRKAHGTQRGEAQRPSCGADLTINRRGNTPASRCLPSCRAQEEEGCTKRRPLLTNIKAQGPCVIKGRFQYEHGICRAQSHSVIQVKCEYKERVKDTTTRLCVRLCERCGKVCFREKIANQDTLGLESTPGVPGHGLQERTGRGEDTI